MAVVGDKISDLTVTTSPASADLMEIETATDGVARKVTLANILALGVSGVTDHGGLGGLTDDDHSIYSLADGTRAYSGKVTITQASTEPCIELDQDDDDEEFIEFDGTSAADGTKSLSSSSGESGACGGKIRVTINGTTKWLRFYDDHT